MTPPRNSPHTLKMFSAALNNKWKKCPSAVDFPNLFAFVELLQRTRPLPSSTPYSSTSLRFRFHRWPELQKHQLPVLSDTKLATQMSASGTTLIMTNLFTAQSKCLHWFQGSDGKEKKKRVWQEVQRECICAGKDGVKSLAGMSAGISSNNALSYQGIEPWIITWRCFIARLARVLFYSEEEDRSYQTAV